MSDPAMVQGPAGDGGGPAHPPGESRPAGLGRVFSNRSLRLEHVHAVGFDMDYTLAIYHQREMDRLQAALTLRRLVGLGYPDSLAELAVPTDFAIRGLLVDTRRGNVLKMDRHRYVKRAYHGLRPLSRPERRDLYETHRPRPAVKRYHWVDTLYSLAEVAVYAGVIEHLERRGEVVDYGQLFLDVRASADAAHAEGEVSRHVEADLPRYLRRDPLLGPTLHRLRSAGKRLFLLSNCRPEQAEAILSFLLDGSVPGYGSWRQFFDVVIVAASKPAFFTSRSPFVEVAQPDSPVEELRRGRIYEGGNMVEFERLVGVSGTDVLYVGDHIYGDVLRANVASGWRTLMIIQELADELAALERRAVDLRRVDEVELRLALTREERRLAGPGFGLGARAQSLEAERDALEACIEADFHPYWGSCFRAGSELSSFGAQVERYAWLYTERVTNLGNYPSNHFFLSPRGKMAHEL